MNINSQYYIAYYAGSKVLDLMTIPTEIAADADKLAVYNRFMQNISAIYGSQDADGEVPVFWTSRSLAGQVLGNPQYSYQPAAASTLQELRPREGYYFIVRDESAVPLEIPYVTEDEVTVDLITSQSDFGTTIRVDDTTLASGVATIPISGVVSNIRPNETYTYEFQSLHTNWPVSIMPLSGTVIPSSKSYSIDADLTFCPSLNTGLCPDGQAGLLDYTAMEGCSINNTDPKSLYQLKLVPTSFEGNTVYSNSAKALCDDCIRKITFDTENYTSSLDDTNVHEFEIALSGLTAGQQYTYSIMPLESNWPTLFITPTGYDFTAYDNTVTIPNSMQFCPTSGFCPPGADGVVPYTQPIKIVNKYFSSFYIRVSPATDCHDNINLDSNNSRQMTVYCNDCL